MNKNRTHSPTVRQPLFVRRSWHLTSSSSLALRYIPCATQLGLKGDPCSSTNKIEVIFDCRNNLVELSSTEIDLVLNFGNDPLGHKLCPGQQRGKSRENEAANKDAFPSSQPPNLPEKFFLFMHRLHKTRFYSRVKHNRVSGLSLRTHGNKS